MNVTEKTVPELGKADAIHESIQPLENPDSEQAKHDLDVAGRYLAAIALRPDAAELLAPFDQAEERAVVRKADRIIVPLLLVALMMGAVDKIALATGAVLGLKTDLKLVGQQYSWASSIIFFGSLTSLFPSLFLMQRLPAGKVISIFVTIWGIIAMCMAASKSFAGLAVCRFILGFFEALTFPGFSLVIVSWYTRREQVVRTALIYSTLSTVTNGLLSYGASFAVGHLKISAWRLLFLLVGAITFSWGILMYCFLPDSPVKARWLTERQRVIAVQRLKDNRTGVENKYFKWSQCREALLDPKSWLVFLIMVCLNVPNGAVSGFNAIIVNSLGFTSRQTTLLSIPTGLCAWFSGIFFSWVAVKTRQRVFSCIVATFIPLLGSILLRVIPQTNTGGSLAAIYLAWFFWGPYVVMTTIVIANTGGYTKKIMAYGIAYSGYLVGNIIGPQTFRAEQAPKYTGGTVAMVTCYGIAIILLVVYFLHIRRLNAQKERHVVEEHGGETLIEEWLDETDFESRRFRYVQ